MTPSMTNFKLKLHIYEHAVGRSDKDKVSKWKDHKAWVAEEELC